MTRLALAGWALFGPRPRITRPEVALAMVWQVAWLVVILASVGVTALLLALMGGAAWLDRHLSPQPPEVRKTSG